MTIHKGDIVMVKAVVFTAYEDGKVLQTKWDKSLTVIYAPDRVSASRKSLLRQEYLEPIPSIVCGWRYVQTGHGHRQWGGVEDYDPGTLQVDKSHQVWVVEAIKGGSGNTDRYYAPQLALESDLQEATA